MKTNEHRPMPPLQYLRSRLRLDRKTGDLIWKKRPDDQFVDPKYALTWNKKNAGNIAGCLKGLGDYRVIRIDGVSYQYHRVVFALANGVDPGAAVVDHAEDSGNRPSNLQAITRKQNVQKKMRLGSKNTSGHLGVYWHTQGEKWAACIGLDGRHKHLGMFDKKDDAVAVRKAAELEHFGAFAPRV